MKKSNKNAVFMISIVVLLIVCLIVLSVLSKKQTDLTIKESKENGFTAYNASNYKVTNDFELKNQPMIGDKDAPVTMVLFSDFSCPYCRNFDLNTMPQLQKDLIDTGKAKLYFMSYSFINDSSYKAAVAAETVYKESPKDFSTYFSAIYRAQKSESIPNWANETSLVEIAKNNKIDVDYKKLENNIKKYKYLDTIYRDRAIGEYHGATGTPALFINGKQINTQDYNAIKKAVESLAKEGASNE